jgi:hypothetical protein
MTKSITTLLVGAYYRAPAKQLLAVLPAGASLRLVPEPDNPHDAKAIRVMVRPSEVPESQWPALEEALVGTGVDLFDLMKLAPDGSAEVQLGYLPDSDGKVCKKEQVPGNRDVAAAVASANLDWPDVRATLAFSPAGKPQVVISWAKQ